MWWTWHVKTARRHNADTRQTAWQHKTSGVGAKKKQRTSSFLRLFAGSWVHTAANVSTLIARLLAKYLSNRTLLTAVRGQLRLLAPSNLFHNNALCHVFCIPTQRAEQQMAATNTEIMTVTITSNARWNAGSLNLNAIWLQRINVTGAVTSFQWNKLFMQHSDSFKHIADYFQTPSDNDQTHFFFSRIAINENLWAQCLNTLTLLLLEG